MKSILAILTITTIFFSCNGGNTNEKSGFVHSDNDSMRVPALFSSPIFKMVKNEIIYRIRVDTFTFVPTDDSLTQKKQWIRWPKYYESVTDSVRDSKTGKPILDSAGHPRLIPYWYEMPTKNVLGVINVNIDSLLRTIK